MSENPDPPQTPESSDPAPQTPPATETPAPEPAAEPPAPGELTSDERTMAILCHVLGIITNFIGPLIIWLIKKDSSAFVSHHGKQALNFQFTVLIGYVVGALTCVVYIGCLIYPAAAIVSIIFGILASVAANKGELYKYPVAIPFFR